MVIPKGTSGFWSRRQMLQWSLAGIGLTGATLGCQKLNSLGSSKAIAIPPLPQNLPPVMNNFNPMTVLRDFDYGTVKQENGRTVREFRITAQNTNVQLNSAVSFITWNFNGRVPGPTLRAKEGDRLRILFFNQSGHAHTMHFHGFHPAAMDGIKPVRNNQATIYEFDAEPYGVHLYHCHIAPVTRHVGKGLYGMLIIDPPTPRPPADEMILVMGAYDVNDDGKNELYAFNGIPDYYMDHPIPIYQNQLTRVYLLNMIEWDVAATFHIHANFFDIYPTGMTTKASGRSDVVTLGTTERHILEFAYSFPGNYMFHPHQDFMAEAGCMGSFEVIPPN